MMRCYGTSSRSKYHGGNSWSLHAKNMHDFPISKRYVQINSELADSGILLRRMLLHLPGEVSLFRIVKIYILHNSVSNCISEIV